jgi:BMFP domain-containing protein YqiC
MVVTIAPVVGGAFWGAFEFYNDYMSMRSAIKNYVSPDFTEYDKKLALMEESTSKVNDYTRDIKNDLKKEIREIDAEVKNIRSDSRAMQKEARDDVKEIRKEVDTKIRRALENPLLNKEQ